MKMMRKECEMFKLGRKLKFSEVKSIFESNGYELISQEYMGARIPLVCKDEEGYFYKISVNNLKRGVKSTIVNKFFAIENIRFYLKKNNPNVILISDKYENAFKKLKCKCILDNYEWCVSWAELSTHSGCPKCANTLRLNINEIKSRVNKINPNIQILTSEYINDRSRLKCKCILDGTEWNSSWGNLRNGHGCPKCAKENVSLGRRLDVNMVREFLLNNKNDMEILDVKYKDGRLKVKYKCRNDGYIAWIRYDHLKNGHGCPVCAAKKGRANTSWRGLSSLKSYIRGNLTEWKKKSMKKCNYKCVITNDRFDDIHHLHSLDDIIKESLNILGLKKFKTIEEYSDQQLQDIIKICLDLHDKYGLGVCLRKDVHEQFHKIYGYKHNNILQFKEFKDRWNDEADRLAKISIGK